MAMRDDQEYHVHDEKENISLKENDNIYEEINDFNGKGYVDVPLLKETGIDFTDPIQLDVLYVQLRNSIINGTQPCTKVEAVVLAAYQCQVQYGNYNKKQHKIGFLNLSEFLPEDFLKVQGIEKEIYSEHCKLIDMTEIDVKCCYITFCRSLKTFGGTYYHVKEKVNWHKNLVPYILGITPRAVLRVDKNTKEVLNEWPYTTVRRYAGKSDMLTLDFGDYSKSCYIAHTTEGEAICQLMAKYIDTLIQNKRSRFDISENKDDSVTVDTTKEEYIETLQLAYEKKKTDHNLALKAHTDNIEEEVAHLQREINVLKAFNTQLQFEKDQAVSELRRLVAELSVENAELKKQKDLWKVSHSEVTLTADELGRGAWGVIWVGIFREQKVAVKQMHHVILSEDNIKLIHREINTMAQLRHPNLIQFIGAVLDDPSGNPMIITEILDTSLRNAYESKQLTPNTACEPIMLTIMRDVAVGLSYLHCLCDPIIHRDISSANVLLESKGPNKWKTKISDFGSANKACQAITSARGALVYSAPESKIAEINTTLTTKMDVYSYGILFCETLTCSFPDPSIFPELCQQILLRTPSLHYIILTCIKLKPSARPTIKQVIERLDNYIKQLHK